MAGRTLNFGVGILLRATDRVSDPSRRAGRGLKKMSEDAKLAAEKMHKATGVMTAGIIGMQAGVKATVGLFNLAKGAGDFEQTMIAVQKITNATTDEFQRLNKEAKLQARQTQFSPLEAAQTLRALTQAGLSADQAIATLRPSLDLAATSLGKLSTAKAGETIFAAAKAFGKPMTEARGIMNSMVNMTNRFNVSAQELPQAIAKISRGSIGLKQGMDDTLVALGLVKNLGGSMSSAATLSSGAMLRIADPTIQKKLRKLGVTFTDINGNFLPFIDIVNNISNTLNNRFTTEQQKAGVAVKLFGTRAFSVYSKLDKQLRSGITFSAALTEGFANRQVINGGTKAILKGADAIRFMKLQFAASRGELEKIPERFVGLRKEAEKVRKLAGKGGGSGDLFVKAQLAAFKGELSLLDGVVKGFKDAVGTPLMAVFKPFIIVAKNALAIVTGAIEAMNPTLKEFIGMFFVAGAVTAIGAGAVLAFKGAMVLLLPIVMAVLAPLAGMLVLVAKIAAVVALLYVAFKVDFLGIKTIAVNTWMGIKSAFDGSFGEIINWFAPTSQMFKAFFDEIKGFLLEWGFMSETTTAKASSGWQTFGWVVGSVLKGIFVGIVTVTGVIAYLVSWVIYLLKWIGKGGRWLLSLVGLATPIGQKSATSKALKARAQAASGTVTKPAGTQPTAPAQVQRAQVPATPGPRSLPPNRTVVVQQTQQQPQTQSMQPRTLVGNVSMNRERVGNVVFQHQNDSRQRSLVRTQAPDR